MKRSCIPFAGWAAAFGVGVLLSICIPIKGILIVAVLTLIALAIRCSALR